jgi:hypothetical protein
MLVLASAVPALTQSAGKAAGTVVANGKKVPLTNVSAVAYDTPNLGRLVSVLLSDKPANPKTFQDYTRIGPGERYVAGMITGAWVTMHADDKAFSGFHFTVNAKRQPILGEVLVGTRENNFGVMDEALVLEISSLTPQLTGRIRTKEPVVALGSQKLGLDATFDAPVTILGK